MSFVPAPRTERGAEKNAPGALRLRTTSPAPGVVVLETAGILDMNSATHFAEALRTHLSAATGTAVLDLSGLSFLSTHGAVVLLEAAHRALMHRAHLVLISQNRIVDRLLEMLDVADRFTYATTVDEAIGLVGSETPVLR
ncbi:STAS domain-containing protein [Saccharopolyspora sp. NPDC050389]|uniref:STAS domain-containing protein n=1 Tax=Saccharopolyspora sp. NPDC050389 TaxID=3155516 RepID=UPI0033E303C1